MFPIYEPEFNFLPFACECGARVMSHEELQLHKQEICLRRLDPNYKQPSIFGSGSTLGVADGGRRT